MPSGRGRHMLNYFPRAHQIVQCPQRFILRDFQRWAVDLVEAQCGRLNLSRRGVSLSGRLGRFSAAMRMPRKPTPCRASRRPGEEGSTFRSAGTSA
jgi:hypothetical protein